MRKFIKFIHSADIHLDNPFSSLASKSGLPHIRKNDLKEVLIRIADKVKESNADFWLICGDFVEMRHLLPSTISFVAKVFEDVKPARVIIIPGNHDPYSSNSFHNMSIFGDNVFFMHKGKPILDFDDVNAVFRYLHDEASLDTDKFTNLNKSLINILMLHGTMDMGFGKNQYNPIESRNLSEKGYDYIAMGHFHKAILGAGKNKEIFNPGSPEPLGFDEPGKHGILQVTLEKENKEPSLIMYEHQSTGIRMYKQLSINISDCKVKADIEFKIHSMIEECGFDNRSTLYKVVLTGKVDLVIKEIITTIILEIQRGYFYIQLVDATTLALNIDEILQGKGIKSEYAKRMITQIDEELGPEKRDKLVQALEIGLSVLEKGFAELEEP